MSFQRIFYLTAQELHVYHWQKGAWYHDNSYQGGPEGLEAFTGYLEGQPEIVSCLLTDLIEEEYRNEKIPYVVGRDRKNMLQRKQRQLFRGTPFRSAIVQGREEGGRRDSKVLFTALTNPEAVRFWLDKIDEYKVPLIGLYSMSMMGRRFLMKLGFKQKYTLLLTQQQGNLLRQSFFDGHDLKSSRLTPFSYAGSEQLIELLSREVQKNQRYLSRLQLLPHNAQLDVCVLCNSEQIETLLTGCANSDELNYHFIDINTALRRIGLKGTMPVQQSEQIFFHLLHSRRKVINYARPVDCRYFSMRKIRSGLVAAGLMISLVSAGWSLSHLYDAGELEERTGMISQQIEKLQVKYELALAALPKVSVIPRNMQSAVQTHDQLLQRRFRPEQLFLELSKGLDNNPRVFVEQVEWFAAESIDADPGTGAIDDGMDMGDDGMMSSPDGMDPMMSSADGMDPMMDQPMDAMDMDEQSQEKEKPLYQIATIKGRLEPTGSDYHASFRLVNSFIESLRRNKAFVEVTPLVMPLDLDPGSILTGDFKSDGDDPTAMFEIKAVLKVDNDAV